MTSQCSVTHSPSLFHTLLKQPRHLLHSLAKAQFHLISSGLLGNMASSTGMATLAHLTFSEGTTRPVVGKPRPGGHTQLNYLIRSAELSQSVLPKAK